MNLGEYNGAGSSTTKLLLHLNGNSNDSSGNSNNGTDTDITYGQAYGKFGQGASFNGSSSKISLPDNFDFGTSGLTVLSWIKTTEETNLTTIFFVQDNDNSNNPIINLSINSDGTVLGQVRGQTNTANLFSDSTTLTVNDGNWHNIILVFDDVNDTGYIYIE